MAVEVEGARLREMRLDRGWTQVELAERAGLSEYTINTLERGTHPARDLTIKHLADAFGVERRALLKALAPAALAR